METKEEILRIIDLLNETYESEEAWHGPSVVEALRDVTPRLADRRLTTDTHTIAELVYHMTTWRIFAVRKVAGRRSVRHKDKRKELEGLRHCGCFGMGNLANGIEPFTGRAW